MFYGLFMAVLPIHLLETKTLSYIVVETQKYMIYSLKCVILNAAQLFLDKNITPDIS